MISHSSINYRGQPKKGRMLLSMMMNVNVMFVKYEIMGNWRNRDSKLQKRTQSKKQQRFFQESTDKRLKKDVIREQRRQREDDYEANLSDV